MRNVDLPPRPPRMYRKGDGSLSVRDPLVDLATADALPPPTEVRAALNASRSMDSDDDGEVADAGQGVDERIDDDAIPINNTSRRLVVDFNCQLSLR